MTDSVQHKARLRDYFNGLGFERWSAIYGKGELSRVRRTIRAGHTAMLARASNWLDETTPSVSPHIKALDAGCGTGLWSTALAQRGFAVTAIDIAPQMTDATVQVALAAGVAPVGSEQPALLAEATILSTCNRVEMYGVATGPDTASELARFFVRRRGLEYRDLQTNLFVHTGPVVVQHLCETTAGMRSIVLGENVVHMTLAQRRTALSTAQRIIGEETAAFDVAAEPGNAVNIDGPAPKRRSRACRRGSAGAAAVDITSLCICRI